MDIAWTATRPSASGYFPSPRIAPSFVRFDPYLRDIYIGDVAHSFPSMTMTKCPVCGVSVKDENLVRHVRNQHPREKVEGLEQMRPPRPKASTRDWKDDLARVGVLLAVAGAVWFVLALLFPTPVGVVIPAFPDLILLLVAGVALLAAGWVLGSTAVQRSGTKFAVLGLVVGLALAGLSAALAAQQGVPVLNKVTTQAQGGWLKADNALWKINGRPVIFYYGSAGCPYCAASSWAIQGALQLFGTLSGVTYITSSPSEQDPALRDIPGVDFVGASFTSSLISLDVVAGNDNQVISAPTPPPVENAYVLTYDTQLGAASFPFYVVGGIYLRAGAIVDPRVFSDNGAMTAAAVQQALASQSGPVYNAVHTAQIYVEAYLAKVCQLSGLTPPSAVTSDPAVAAVLAQL